MQQEKPDLWKLDQVGGTGATVLVASSGLQLWRPYKNLFVTDTSYYSF